MTLYLLCGPAFAGKSTLARAIAASRGWPVVSLDAINGERGLPSGGEGIPGEQWERSHRVALARLAGLLAAGRPILFDDTCCWRWLRDRLRQAAAAAGYRTRVLYLDIPRSELERRRRASAAAADRPGIRDDLFAAHLATFEPPGADEDALLVDSTQDAALWIDAHLPPAVPAC